MEPVEPLTNAERHYIEAIAAEQGLTKAEWIAYELRSGIEVTRRLGARIPLEGGLGRVGKDDHGQA